MAKKPETIFRERVIPKFKRIPNTWFESIQQTSISGTPDVLGCVNGFFVALEFKKDAKTSLEDLQKYKLGKINKAGGFGFKVNPSNWKEIYNFIIELSKRRKHGIQTNTWTD